jgi:hypothetical protein
MASTTTLETVTEVVVKPAEPTSKEEKGRIANAGSERVVRIVSLIVIVARVIGVPRREAKTVGGGKVVARRASRIHLRCCRRCDERNAAGEEKRVEPSFSAIH